MVDYLCFFTEFPILYDWGSMYGFRLLLNVKRTKDLIYSEKRPLENDLPLFKTT